MTGGLLEEEWWVNQRTVPPKNHSIWEGRREVALPGSGSLRPAVGPLPLRAAPVCIMHVCTSPV